MRYRDESLIRPSWLRLCAYAAFAAVLPSALWRVLMIVGLIPGTGELRRFELADNPTLGYAYVVALSIVQLATGYLAVGLVRPWGERLRGRRVPPAVPPRPRHARWSRRDVDLPHHDGGLHRARQAPRRRSRLGMATRRHGVVLSAPPPVGSAGRRVVVGILALSSCRTCLLSAPCPRRRGPDSTSWPCGTGGRPVLPEQPEPTGRPRRAGEPPPPTTPPA